MIELYHFCNLESFYNIFSTNPSKLRLVNSYRMNDYFENKWFFTIMENAIKETGHTLTAKKYLAEIERIHINFNMLFATYVSSFSSTDIRLPLWREYADNGKGVAIVLDLDNVRETINKKNAILKKSRFRFEEVIYEYDKQKEIVCNFLKDDKNVNSIQGFIKKYYVVFKHPTFEYEHEYRLIYETEKFIDGPLDKINIGDNEINFAYSNGNKGIFSYVDFPLDMEIERIELGPRFDEANQNKRDISHRGFSLEIQSHSDLAYFLIKNGFSPVNIHSDFSPYCGS